MVMVWINFATSQSPITDYRSPITDHWSTICNHRSSTILLQVSFGYALLVFVSLNLKYFIVFIVVSKALLYCIYNLMRFLNFQLGKFFQLEKIPKNYMQRNLGREVYPKDFITRDLCPEGSLLEQTHLSILCFNTNRIRQWTDPEVPHSTLCL